LRPFAEARFSGTVNFRRIERFAMVLCVLSLLLVPLLVSIHPPVLQVTRDLLHLQRR